MTCIIKYQVTMRDGERVVMCGRFKDKERFDRWRKEEELRVCYAKVPFQVLDIQMEDITGKCLQCGNPCFNNNPFCSIECAKAHEDYVKEMSKVVRK